MKSFAAPAQLAEALRQGNMIVLLDDEDRENEGDLVMAASLVTPASINFMATHARGLICLTITEARARQLHLPLMVDNNQSSHATNFTVSIEAATGVSTGISARDRAHTVLTAVKPDATAQDLVRPGHVFPLIARNGGVLVRAGHTEAGCDLVGMAGLEPAAVIVEILNQDGSMARREHLLSFARQHSLQIGTIADLIAFRLANERTVHQTHQRAVSLAQGDFTMHVFADDVSGTTHLALCRELVHDRPPLVRVHQYAGVSDAIGLGVQGHWSLQHALGRIATEGGILLLLHYQHESEVRLQEWLQQTTESQEDLRHHTYISHGTGAQILRDLGVGKMRLLSSNLHFGALAAFGLEIVEFVEPEDSHHNQ